MEYDDARQYLASALDETLAEALSAVFHEEAMEQLTRSLEAQLASPTPDAVEAHRAAVRADCYDRAVATLRVRLKRAEPVKDVGGL